MVYISRNDSVRLYGYYKKHSHACAVFYFMVHYGNRFTHISLSLFD